MLMGALFGFALVASIQAQQMWVDRPSNEWIATLSANCVESLPAGPAQLCCRNYTKIWVEGGKEASEMGGALLVLRTDLARGLLAKPPLEASSAMCSLFQNLLDSSLTPQQRTEEALRALRAHKEGRRLPETQLPQVVNHTKEEEARIDALYAQGEISKLVGLCMESAKTIYAREAPPNARKRDEILFGWDIKNSHPFPDRATHLNSQYDKLLKSTEPNDLKLANQMREHFAPLRRPRGDGLEDGQDLNQILEFMKLERELDTERHVYEIRAARELAAAWDRWLRAFLAKKGTLNRNIIPMDVPPFNDFVESLNDISDAASSFEGQRTFHEGNMNQSLALIKAVQNRLQQHDPVDNDRSDATPLPPRLGQNNTCWINEEYFFTRVNEAQNTLGRPFPTLDKAELNGCYDLVRYAALSLLPAIRAEALAEAKKFSAAFESYRNMVAQSKVHCDLGWAISDVLDKAPNLDPRDPAIAPKLKELLSQEGK